MTSHVDLQDFTPNHVNTNDIRSGVHCRLRNGVIDCCVESSLEKVDLRLPLYVSNVDVLLSQRFHRPEPRMFKSLSLTNQSAKPQYRPENPPFGHKTKVSFHFPPTAYTFQYAHRQSRSYIFAGKSALKHMQRYTPPV